MAAGGCDETLALPQVLPRMAARQKMASAAGTQLPPNQQWRITSLLHELENLAGCKDALAKGVGGGV